MRPSFSPGLVGTLVYLATMFSSSAGGQTASFTSPTLNLWNLCVNVATGKSCYKPQGVNAPCYGGCASVLSETKQGSECPWQPGIDPNGPAAKFCAAPVASAPGETPLPPIGVAPPAPPVAPPPGNPPVNQPPVAPPTKAPNGAPCSSGSECASGTCGKISLTGSGGMTCANSPGLCVCKPAGLFW